MTGIVSNVDTYRPTAKERKLIETMSDPVNRHLNISELCQAAGISREAYYRMFRKAEFVKYYKLVQFEAVKGNIAKIIGATIDYAVNNPKCHQDRKMLLEMGDMYTEKIKQEHSGQDGQPLQVIFGIPRPTIGE